ncbi:MAG TPA: hypothetical protein PKY59_11000 [Pyrinomonadaceae bacterium]|nr:hypothetical protein [Pyrinomonadaceae bacterium]
MLIKTSKLKNFVAFCLLLSVFLTSSMVVLAKSESQLSAEITFSDNVQASENSSVKLNGENIISGRTFFSGGVISTTEKSGATVSLGKMGYLTLAPNTVLNLQFSENSINGTVSAGSVEVFNSENVAVNIETAGNGVVKSKRRAPSNSVLIPTIIFAAIVGGVLIYTLTNGDDDVLSPTR